MNTLMPSHQLHLALCPATPALNQYEHGIGQQMVGKKFPPQVFKVPRLTVQRPRDIAQEAYEQARRFLTHELRQGSSFQQIIEHNTSLGEVQSIVERAKHTYNTAVGKRKVVFQWLGKVSQRLLYYGTVLDMLSQHHPEYTALAWGSVKFILTVRQTLEPSMIDC